MSINKIFTENKVIPVVVIDDANDAPALADALLEGGIKVIEITLRTPSGLEAIKALSDKDILVGAGTVTSKEDFARASDAGAKFIVSPGFTGELIGISNSSDVPYIPGVVTPSEVMMAVEYGFTYLKFFPADLFGGIKSLKNFRDLFSEAQFFPTGGIGPKTFKKYLELSNVFCVGGSWVATKDLISEKNWAQITKNAKEASI